MAGPVELALRRAVTRVELDVNDKGQSDICVGCEQCASDLTYL
jgi:hypothetical protein